MRPVKVVEALPHSQFLVEIHVVAIREKLVELVLVGSVRPLDLSVELWRLWLDVDVFHALVSYMPVEERLELVAAVGSDGLDPEGELLDDVIDEVDGVGLGVTLVDLQRANSSRVVDRGVLVAPHRPTSFPLQSQELDVHLYVMARDLFLVAVGVYSSPPDTVRESIQAVPFTDPVDGRVRCLDAEIPLQIPDDPYRAHVVGPAQVQDLPNHFFRGLVRVVVGDAHSTRQTLVA